MARRRFTINDDGELEDRHGTVLGKVVGITLDLPSTSPLASPDPAASAGIAGAAERGTTGGASVFFGGLGEDEGTLTDVAGMGGRGNEHDPVVEIWRHYCAAMQPRHQGLDSEGRKVIKEALKVATFSECKRAIDGCRSSAFHMGENEQRRKYNALSQILRGKRGRQTTRERIDFFLELAEKSGLPSGVPSGLNDKVRRAKRAILDAAEFPGDEQVVERGRKAEAWLVEQGWRVERSEGEMPRFLEPGA